MCVLLYIGSTEEQIHDFGSYHNNGDNCFHSGRIIGLSPCAAKALVSLCIYIGFPEPSSLYPVINTKLKCTDSFDLFFALLFKIYYA